MYKNTRYRKDQPGVYESEETDDLDAVTADFDELCRTLRMAGGKGEVTLWEKSGGEKNRLVHGNDAGHLVQPFVPILRHTIDAKKYPAVLRARTEAARKKSDDKASPLYDVKPEGGTNGAEASASTQEGKKKNVATEPTAVPA